MKFFITTIFLFFQSFCHSPDIDLSRFSLYIEEHTIQEKMQEVAQEIGKKYQEQPLTIVMIMKGSICFAADLLRLLPAHTTLEFIQCSSYGKNGLEPGSLTITGIENLDIEGKNILLIDDIFDTGNTLYQVKQKLKEKKPQNIETLVLLSKGKKHPKDFKPNYILFPIENQFVIGYGLDYKESYRGLPSIYKLDH